MGCRLGTACAAIGTLDKDDERVYAPSSSAIFASCDTFRSHSRWTNTISGGRDESVSRREVMFGDGFGELQPAHVLAKPRQE